MNILILIEGTDDGFVAQVETVIATADADGGSVEIRTASDRSALESALEHLSDMWDGLILTPEPGDGNAALGALTGDLDCFSVEVQPTNIASTAMPTSGTDAQLFGLGVSGYALALELILQRGVR